MIASFALVAALMLGVAEPDSPEPPSNGPSAPAPGLDLAAISRRVEEIRGLRFVREVSVEHVGAAAVREYVRKRVDRFTTPQEVAAEERVDRILGLLPNATPLLEAYAGIVGDVAAGYYDPAEKTFFLLSDLPSAAGPVLAAHELTHALEDQHYDLDRRIDAVRDDADRSFALSALHEGSASLVMAAYVARGLKLGWLRSEDLTAMGETEAKEQEKMTASPAVLRRPLLGAYVLGAAFLARGDAAVTRGARFPAADVNRVTADPPRSSEQLLHPEKYWDPKRRDEPIDVAEPNLAAVLGTGWRQEAAGRFGELFLGLLVGAPTPSEWTEATLAGSAWTNEAASGWGGDAWSLWIRDERAVLALVTVWDTGRDARQFAAEATKNPKLRVERRGARVAVLAGDLEGAPIAELLRSLLGR